MAQNNAKLPDLKTLLQAGIDPLTKLPRRMSECRLKGDIKRFFRIMDEQDACSRYKWFNLPCNLTSQELERMIYYKGQLAFFYFKELDEFYFMPYALDGTIDFYGRFNSVHPIPFTNGTDEDKNFAKTQTTLLAGKKLNCVYEVKELEELDEEMLDNSCVLLHDYTKQLSQTILPRQEINEPILDTMAEIVPYLRTSLIASTGIKGMRVNDADQYHNVIDASRGIKESALNGDIYTAIIGNTEFQDLTTGASGNAEQYLLSLQALDNLRLSAYGLENGGVFEKKAHVLQAEADLNQANTGLIMQDGLSIRQNFCNIVNSIWGLSVWCEPSENVLGVDIDGDGVAYDEDFPQEEPQESEVLENGDNNI